MLCWKVLGVNLDTLMSVESMKQNPVKTEVNQAEEEEEETLLAISSITNSARTGTKICFLIIVSTLPTPSLASDVFSTYSTLHLHFF